VIDAIRGNDVANALEMHERFGRASFEAGDDARALFEIRHCRNCDRRWVRYSIERVVVDQWRESPNMAVTTFTDDLVESVDTAPGVAAR
jgi:hypothetical protein